MHGAHQVVSPAISTNWVVVEAPIAGSQRDQAQVVIPRQRASGTSLAYRKSMLTTLSKLSALAALVVGACAGTQPEAYGGAASVEIRSIVESNVEREPIPPSAIVVTSRDATTGLTVLSVIALADKNNVASEQWDLQLTLGTDPATGAVYTFTNDLIERGTPMARLEYHDGIDTMLHSWVATGGMIQVVSRTGNATAVEFEDIPHIVDVAPWNHATGTFLLSGNVVINDITSVAR